MANKDSKSKRRVSTLDLLAFIAAIIYMQSVLTVAHHTSMWAHNGISRTVDSPAIFVLIVGVLLTGYSWYKNKFRLSMLCVITLTILATASLFWLSGLRTNFYF